MIVIKTVETPGWDAGARTLAALSGDGALTFSVGQATGVVCGLNGADEQAHYREIEHAFYIEPRGYRILESGVEKTAKASRPSGAIFRIERVAGVVRYFVDDVPVYTSQTPSGGPVFGDCSLYANGDSIIDVEVTAVDRTAGTLAIGQVAARGNDEPIDAGFVALGRLIVSGSESDRARGALAVGPVWSKGGDRAFSAGVIAVGPVKVAGSEVAELLPDYGSGFLNVGPVHARGAEVPADVAEGALEVGPLAARGADAPTSLGKLDLGPVGLAGYSLPAASLSAHWPYWQADIRQFAMAGMTDGIGVADGALPALAGSASGFRAGGDLLALLPALVGSAAGGGACQCLLPALAGEAAGVALGLGRAVLDLPALTGEASGLAGSIGRAVSLLPALTGEASGAAAALGDLPALTGEASGLAGSIGRAVLDLPALIGNAAGVAWGIGRAVLDLPAFLGSAGEGVRIMLELPAPEGHAIGRAGSEDGEVLAVNINTGAVTRWLLGPADKLATAHGRLYGIRDGVLFAMEGPTDLQNAGIAVEVRFAQQNFGTLQAKRPRAVYLDCRETAGVVLSVIADEKAEHVYLGIPDAVTAMGTHKVKIGQGIKFHTLGVRVKNRDGDPITISGIEFVGHTFSPRIKT